MQRRIAQALLPRLPLGAMSYATAPNDYSVVMKKAAELVTVEEASMSAKEAGYTSGAPLDTFARPARIYCAARNASQSGLARTIDNADKTPVWRISFNTTAKWANPLMGWTSTADTLENVGRASLFFYTADEAKRFCEKHGWGYTVDEPNIRKTQRTKRYASYSDNFSVKRKGLPDLGTLPSNRSK
ncbi:hypothetical protein HYH03_006606 [Edaphochlamys debaryana]|uniref:NADH dehydrogenase [ubiquinone] iron-sulfur protein 4, mitochondrial n=1 Tax=Edaphochlamys debaryana TaxID=47281 RepID=A0A835Y713_9CHLO|nr:hypothetical protein HYH03_006606 [Edaphochlamys debaryana]|eukprot:KAG2495336.1 hypothetical protein HYH03_006606 [Edaphochlamys debaryana]